jgi:hypothetical protein
MTDFHQVAFLSELSRNFLGNFSGLSRNFLARGVKWNVSRAGPERDIAPERAERARGTGTAARGRD